MRVTMAAVCSTVAAENTGHASHQGVILNHAIAPASQPTMLSYRHAFHAGNFADVHKHAVLSLLLAALRKKDSPFCCIDTHAGAGRYDLQSAEGQKNREYLNGIGRLWGRGDVPPALDAYLAAVRALNADAAPEADGSAAPRYYPGSPRIARHHLRPQDRLVLTELHSTDVVNLRNEFKGDPQVAVHHLDGYQGLKAFLPPKERRGLVLIDPAFELHDEVERAVEGLHAAWRRWPQGIYAFWYPITHRAFAQGIHQSASKLGISKTLVAEIEIRPPHSARQLNGSGMLIVNPPWRIEADLKAICNWLAPALAEDGGQARVEWLISE